MLCITTLHIHTYSYHMQNTCTSKRCLLFDPDYAQNGAAQHDNAALLMMMRTAWSALLFWAIPFSRWFLRLASSLSLVNSVSAARSCDLSNFLFTAASKRTVYRCCRRSPLLVIWSGQVPLVHASNFPCAAVGLSYRCTNMGILLVYGYV